MIRRNLRHPGASFHIAPGGGFPRSGVASKAQKPEAAFRSSPRSGVVECTNSTDQSALESCAGLTRIVRCAWNAAERTAISKGSAETVLREAPPEPILFGMRNTLAFTVLAFLAQAASSSAQQYGWAPPDHSVTGEAPDGHHYRNLRQVLHDRGWHCRIFARKSGAVLGAPVAELGAPLTSPPQTNTRPNLYVAPRMAPMAPPPAPPPAPPEELLPQQ
jgi:hypothetical protein